MMRSLKLAVTTGIGLSLASFAPDAGRAGGLLVVAEPWQTVQKTCDVPHDERGLVQRLLISSAVAAPVSAKLNFAAVTKKHTGSPHPQG